MIILGRTTSSLEMVLAGAVATNELPCVVNWVDLNTVDQSVSAVGESDVTSSGTSVMPLVVGPAKGHTRTIKSLSLYNADTTGATATIQYNNNGVKRILVKILLSVGDTLEYVE